MTLSFIVITLRWNLSEDIFLVFTWNLIHQLARWSIVQSVSEATSQISFFPPLTSARSVLKNPKTSASEPFDGLPQILFKECHTSLCKPLARLFNISFLLGEVPGLWKNAIVTAIPKQLEATKVSEYRPISLTPTAAEVMEKLIFDKLSSWFDKFHLIPVEQHGFLPGSSTCTNLLDTWYDVCRAVNNGKSVDAIHLDLSKAFDKVCYPKLISKLERYGVRGKTLSLIKAYLYGGSLTVRVGISFSGSYACTSGVPQGGVLSPLLFLIYTIELPQLLKTCSDIHVQIYADDIKVYAAYDDTNSGIVQQALRLSMERVNEWASSWDIPLDLNKCLVMHFGNAIANDYIINGMSPKY
uniref:RNA-directed DNA polymerase (Reverse transcriptase) domain containing protein n=1 Tax=Haemonchus contortus TaxID=6289 RepID=W6NRX8_HAECO